MRVSEISLYDYITINATWHFLHNERQFNCDEQRVKYQDKNKTQLEDFLNKNGCNHRITKHVRHKVRNIEFYSCVCDFRNPMMNLYVELHDMYNKGILLYDGGVDNQPAQMIEIFNVLDLLYDDRNRKIAEAHKKAMESKHG